MKIAVALMAFSLGQPAHDFYTGWTNKMNQGCCNQHDCRVLSEEHERTHNGRLEVWIEDRWCPVLWFKYLQKGNVPNPLYSHVCVRPPRPGAVGPGLPDPRPPCDRFLCYQPRPLS